MRSLDMTRSPAASTVAVVLAEDHRRFLAFLERRGVSRDVAEDLVQEAVVRAAAKALVLPTDESAVAWFYQVLRNALVDHHRRAAVRRRALERLAREPVDAQDGHDADLDDTVRACVRSLVTTLRDDYADAIMRVDLDGLAAGVRARAGQHTERRRRAPASSPSGVVAPSARASNLCAVTPIYGHGHGSSHPSRCAGRAGQALARDGVLLVEP